MALWSVAGAALGKSSIGLTQFIRNCDDLCVGLLLVIFILVIWLIKKRRDDRVAVFMAAHQPPAGYRDEEVNLLGEHGVGLNYYLAE